MNGIRPAPAPFIAAHAFAQKTPEKAVASAGDHLGGLNFDLFVEMFYDFLSLFEKEKSPEELKKSPGELRVDAQTNRFILISGMLAGKENEVHKGFVPMVQIDDYMTFTERGVGNHCYTEVKDDRGNIGKIPLPLIEVISRAKNVAQLYSNFCDVSSDVFTNLDGSRYRIVEFKRGKLSGDEQQTIDEFKKKVPSDNEHETTFRRNFSNKKGSGSKGKPLTMGAIKEKSNAITGRTDPEKKEPMFPDEIIELL